jgi:hypothetical protein
MIEKKCEYCGKVMTTGQVRKGNRFCSTKCASLGVYEADVDRDYPWERLPGRMWKCRYVESGEIACRGRRCSKCGWNPEVAEARTEAIRQRNLAQAAEGTTEAT